MFGRATITLGIGPHSSFTSTNKISTLYAVSRTHVLISVVVLYDHQKWSYVLESDKSRRQYLKNHVKIEPRLLLNVNMKSQAT